MPDTSKGPKTRHASPAGYPGGGFYRKHLLHWFDGDLKLEVWSAPDAGFWIVCKKKQITVHAKFYEAAWTKLIQALDPEIETVKFDRDYIAPPVFRPSRPRDFRKLFAPKKEAS